MPKTLSGPETLTFGDIPHIKLFLSTDAVQSNFKDYHHPSINGIYLRYVSPKKYQSHPNTNRCEKAHPPARPKKATRPGLTAVTKTDWAEPMRTLSMASHSTFLGLLGLVLHGHRLDVVPLAGVWERHKMRQLYDSKKTKKVGETVGSLSIDSIVDGLLCCSW